MCSLHRAHGLIACSSFCLCTPPAWPSHILPAAREPASPCNLLWGHVQGVVSNQLQYLLPQGSAGPSIAALGASSYQLAS